MKWFILVTVLALLAFGLPVGLTISGVVGGDDSARTAGVGLNVDSRWISLEAFYSVRDRGTAARDQAWAGTEPSRGATHVRTVHLAGVPNLLGRARHAAIAMRTMGGAAYTVARYFLAASTEGAERGGGHDADRR